jgi:hypothetical protein
MHSIERHNELIGADEVILIGDMVFYINENRKLWMTLKLMENQKLNRYPAASQ